MVGYNMVYPQRIDFSNHIRWQPQWIAP